MRPPETLTTERLVLKRSRREDAPAIFSAYATDPEVTRYLIWRPHESLADTEAHLARSQAAWEDDEVYGWQIWLDAALIGGIALRPEQVHRASVGFALARPHWGRGYAAEAIGALRDWAFGEAGYRRLWAVCDVDNHTSARAMEKAGFLREGVLRRWIVHPNLDAAPRDCLCYAATR